MRPFVLIVFPLVLLMVTGFIYTSYIAWYSNCGYDITCSGGITNPIPTTDPLFSLLNGNYTAIFSNLLAISFGTGTWTIALPTFNVPYPSLAWPSVSWGTFNINACSLFGFSCSFTIPIPFLTSPFIGWNNWSINAGNLNIPIPTNIGLGFISGIIMLLVGLGISVKFLGEFGVGISDSGAKTLQTLGISVLLFTFTSAFTGGWVNTLPSPFSAIIYAALALCVVVGAVWQSQTEI